MKITTIEDLISIRSFTNEFNYDFECEMTFDQAINSLENSMFQVMQQEYQTRPELKKLHQSISSFCSRTLVENFEMLTEFQRKTLGSLSYASSLQLEQIESQESHLAAPVGRKCIDPVVKVYLLKALEASVREFGDYEPFRLFYNDFLDNNFNFEAKKHLFPSYVFYPIDGISYFPVVPRAKPSDTSWARSLKQTLKSGIEVLLTPFPGRTYYGESLQAKEVTSLSS